MYKIIKVAIIISVCLILFNSFVFMGLAIYRSLHAYTIIAKGQMEQRPGVDIAESLDSFMIGLFFIIFAMGIAKLFLPKSNFFSGYDLPWLKVDNFAQLKYIMWEMLLTTIFVFFAAKLIIIDDKMEWTLLIYPASILMLAIAYKFLRHPH